MLNVKENLLSMYTRRLVRNSLVERHNVGYTRARLLGVLYTHHNAQQYSKVLRFIERIEVAHKKPCGLCYLTINNETYEGMFPTFTKDDIGLWGQITNQQVIEFLNTPFDYLYHLDLVSNATLDYVLAKCKAKCRIGYFNPARAHLFEMMVKFENKIHGDELDDLIMQMFHYTQLLETR